MRYQFEVLPSSNHLYTAYKILFEGKQVGVIEHMHSSHNSGPVRDWRVFRLNDRSQVQPWKAQQPLHLEKAQELIQTIEPSVFTDPVKDDNWMVVYYSAYGYTGRLEFDADGYLQCSRRADTYDFGRCQRVINDFKERQSVYMSSGGDRIERIELVHVSDQHDVKETYEFPAQ